MPLDFGPTGFLGALGQGLRGAGGVLSKDVYDTQSEEGRLLATLQNRTAMLQQQAIIQGVQNGSIDPRDPQVQQVLQRMGMPAMQPNAQVQQRQEQLDADRKFGQIVGGSEGLRGSTLRSSADLLKTLEQVPLDVLARSPAAQHTLSLAGTLQSREAAQEDRKEKIGLAREALEQRAKEAEQRSEDKALDREARAQAQRESLALRSQIAGMTAALKKGDTEDAALQPDELRFLARQAWTGDTSVFQNIGRGAQGAKNIVALRREIMTVGKEMGRTPEELAALNAEFQGLKAGERSLGTRIANIEMAVTEAQQLAPLALQASSKVDRSKYPALNTVILAAEKGTGDENVVRLGVATNSLINIYARAISPTGVPTVSDKDHARELLASAWSKGQYNAGVDQLMKELDAARKSPGIVRRSFRDAVTGEKEAPAAPAKADPLGIR